MADAIKLDVLKRLTAHLKLITPDHDNEYEFDLSLAVFRGRRVYGDDDPKTMLSIVEHLQPDSSYQPAAEEGVGTQEDWILLVQGWADGVDKDNPTDKLYQMEATVRQHLSRLIATVRDDKPEFPDEFMLGLYGKGISGIRLGPGVVGNILPDVSDRNFFWLPLVIELALDSRQPFVV